MIDNPTPVIVPPSAAQTYPQLWTYALNVMLPSTDSGRIRMELLPYNEADGKIAENIPATVLETDQFWLAHAEVPELKTAMDAILAAVGPMNVWMDEQAAKQEEQADAES